MNPFLGQRPLTSARRSWGQRIVLLFNLSLIGASLTVAGLLNYANERASSVNRVALDRSLTELPAAEAGSRVINILLVGSDSSANLAKDDPIQIGRHGERLGDVIIVAHLDERSGRIALLSLPRDLWIPLAGTERDDRINRAFLVGGAATLIDTIEEAFDVPIHHYVNVDFAGFQGLVEAVGTVDVYFETPARDWNISAKPEPRSQTGFQVTTAGCHALDPDEALAYVRSRYYQTQRQDGAWVTDPTSDLGRIRRQQDFLQRLLQQAIELGARNPLVLADLIDTGIQNVAIDQELTPSLLIDLSATYRGFEPGDLETHTFPVTDGTVGSNRVLIPQMGDAEPLLELFRGARFEDPETVGLDLVYDPSLVATAEGPTRLPPLVSTIASSLADAGFDVGEPRPATTEAGLFIRHGSNGDRAAEVVEAALGPSIRWSTSTGIELSAPLKREEVGGLSGRNVVVALGPGVSENIVVSALTGPAWAVDSPPEAEPGPVGNGEMAAGAEQPLGLTQMPSELIEPQLVAGPEAVGVPRPCD
ncbi:MAG: LCP family protein [Actinomycetia bacterium]|nr:LCP family protein [Actinomycetes bacterium]